MLLLFWQHLHFDAHCFLFTPVKIWNNWSKSIWSGRSNKRVIWPTCVLALMTDQAVAAVLSPALLLWEAKSVTRGRKLGRNLDMAARECNLTDCHLKLNYTINNWFRQNAHSGVTLICQFTKESTVQLFAIESFSDFHNIHAPSPVVRDKLENWLCKTLLLPRQICRKTHTSRGEGKW